MVIRLGGQGLGQSCGVRVEAFSYSFFQCDHSEFLHPPDSREADTPRQVPICKFMPSWTIRWMVLSASKSPGPLVSGFPEPPM